MNQHLLVVAGEVSSDRHAAKLIRNLKNHKLRISAVGGREMREVSDYLEENVVARAAVGFTEVIKEIPFFLRLKKRIQKKYFSHKSPDRVDALVLIDYPGFNVPLAKAAFKNKIPVFYYITPQVWAWGKGRIATLTKICRKLYCVFEFEKEVFKEAGEDVVFVGHPILEDIPEKIDRESFREFHGIKKHEPLLALLPGSRKREVSRHLPVMVEAAKRLSPQPRTIIGKPSTLDEKVYKKYVDSPILSCDIYSLIKSADVCTLSSGTSTLEASIIGTPFVTVYSVSPISYAIARRIVKIPYVCMANILAGEKVTPELIQSDLTPDNLSEELKKMLSSEEKRKSIKEDLKRVSEKLGSSGASGRTAESIVETLRQN